MKKRKVLVIIIGVLVYLIAMGAFVLMNGKEEKEDTHAYNAELQEKAGPLSEEIEELKSERDYLKEEATKETVGPYTSIVYYISSQDQLERIGEDETIAINLDADEELKEAVKGRDIILTGEARNEEELSSGIEEMEPLAYWLKTQNESNSYLSALSDCGIDSVLVYTDSISISSYSDYGQSLIGYSFIKSTSFSPSERLNEIKENADPIIFVVDMALSDEYITNVTELIRNGSEENGITVRNTSELLSEALEFHQTHAEGNEGLNEEMNEIEERISELEEELNEIYSSYSQD